MDDDKHGSVGQCALGCCPHVDRNDLRCATRFNLGRIDQAFSVCFGAFHACPMYHRMNLEQSDQAPMAEPSPGVVVNAHGLSLPLLPTGT